MKRSPVVLGVTAVALAAVLSYRTHDLTSSAASSTTSTGIVRRGATGSSTTTASSSTTSSSTESSSSAATSTTTTSTTAASVSGTATGTAEETRYGVVQVRVTVSDGRITDVTAVQLTATDAHSEQINAQAVPELRSEVLSAQSAQIDGVSGATFTSEGYEASLQSALDKIGFTS